MSFHTFVPAEFHHGVRAMSYDDQLIYLYEIVVAPVYLRPGLGSHWTPFPVSISSACHLKIQTYIDEIKRMRAEHDEDSINEYTKETIKKFFEDRGSSWLGYGYTDEYAWGEILKKAENEDMIAEIIVRLNMYWDVQYVKSTIDAFYNKASEQMKERIAEKKDEIEKFNIKFNINFNAKQILRRARLKMSSVRKSLELKFVLQFRRIATGEEVPKGIDKEAVEKVWDLRKYYKSIFDSNDYGKQVSQLIIMYNSTRKKIKGRLVLYGILKDDSTWRGEIRLSTEDADNLAYFRRKVENMERKKVENMERNAEERKVYTKKREKEIKEQDNEWKRKTEEATRKMYN